MGDILSLKKSLDFLALCSWKILLHTMDEETLRETGFFSLFSIYSCTFNLDLMKQGASRKNPMTHHYKAQLI